MILMLLTLQTYSSVISTLKVTSLLWIWKKNVWRLLNLRKSNRRSLNHTILTKRKSINAKPKLLNIKINICSLIRMVQKTKSRQLMLYSNLWRELREQFKSTMWAHAIVYVLSVAAELRSYNLSFSVRNGYMLAKLSHQVWLCGRI